MPALSTIEPKRISELNHSPVAVDTMLLAAVNSAGETVNVNARAVADLYVPDLNKCDVHLCNVDNTSDMNKPVSIAAAQALALKSDVNHTHLSQSVTDFEPAVKEIIDNYSSVIFDSVNSNW